ncbi:hypothetical protein MtrunA17_Chr3g0103781 [Medicago truncatula]|uniref:Transmembrane protein, putative n=1 Tax=Medicago truncatula TaxID=3880 RepID=A0A072V7J8_MEDTR|nr:transmembrane protein, putative [Medicago truncatula]RHN67539.1 hypothetical protein MtrunA17_Chr3g0103781 [Medicago truncatula]
MSKYVVHTDAWIPCPTFSISPFFLLSGVSEVRTPTPTYNNACPCQLSYAYRDKNFLPIATDSIEPTTCPPSHRSKTIFYLGLGSYTTVLLSPYFAIPTLNPNPTLSVSCDPTFIHVHFSHYFLNFNEKN